MSDRDNRLSDRELRSEGKLEQEIEIRRNDERRIDGRGQTQRV